MEIKTRWQKSRPKMGNRRIGVGRGWMALQNKNKKQKKKGRKQDIA